MQVTNMVLGNQPQEILQDTSQHSSFRLSSSRLSYICMVSMKFSDLIPRITRLMIWITRLFGLGHCPIFSELRSCLFGRTPATKPGSLQTLFNIPRANSMGPGDAFKLSNGHVGLSHNNRPPKISRFPSVSPHIDPKRVLKNEPPATHMAHGKTPHTSPKLF